MIESWVNGDTHKKRTEWLDPDAKTFTLFPPTDRGLIQYDEVPVKRLHFDGKSDKNSI